MQKPEWKYLVPNCVTAVLDSGLHADIKRCRYSWGEEWYELDVFKVKHFQGGFETETFIWKARFDKFEKAEAAAIEAAGVYGGIAE